MEIIAVLVIQPVKHRHVLQQLCLVRFEGTGNVFHVGRYFAVTGFHPFNLVLSLCEKTCQAFLILGIPFKALQFRHQVHQHITDFTGILGFDRVQRCL